MIIVELFHPTCHFEGPSQPRWGGVGTSRFQLALTIGVGENLKLIARRNNAKAKLASKKYVQPVCDSARPLRASHPSNSKVTAVLHNRTTLWGLHSTPPIRIVSPLYSVHSPPLPLHHIGSLCSGDLSLSSQVSTSFIVAGPTGSTRRLWTITTLMTKFESSPPRLRSASMQSPQCRQRS